MEQTYEDFLHAKTVIATGSGLSCEQSEIHPWLKPFSKDIVQWAVKGGCRAIFSAFGLHKTVTQLEIVRLCLAKSGGGVGIIVCPLGVRQEFFRDAEKVGTTIKFVRRTEEILMDGIYLTNYESVRDRKLDPTKAKVVSLDEASILRGFGGTKTFREFMAMFEGSSIFRFVATATPSPNEFIELLAYAAFLGVMDVGQAKTRFFKRDSTKADKLTLHPHKEKEFWLWMSSWAIFLQKPSDLGYDDVGYEFPPLDVRWHELPSDHSNAGVEKDGQHRMFKNAAIGVSTAAKEKRSSLGNRIAKMGNILYKSLGVTFTEETYADGERSEPEVLQREPREDEGSGAQVVSREQASDRPIKEEEISKAIRGDSSSKTDDESAEKNKERDAEYPVLERREISGRTEEASAGEERDKSARAQGSTDEAIRINDGSISIDAQGSGREVLDMRNVGHEQQASIPAGRSRSRNRKGKGASLSRVQPRAGALQGQPSDSIEGGGLSEQIIIWCDLNDEQRAIEGFLEQRGISYSSIKGELSLEEQERRMQNWKNKETCVLIGKTVMLGSGVNMQQCHKMMFLGVGYKFQEFIQAIHRIQRFGQLFPCSIHVLYTEAEREIRAALERKWENHKVLVAEMSRIIREYGLASEALKAALGRTLGCERQEESGPDWKMVNNDSVVETKAMLADSVDLILTSIPFATQYEYSPSYNDFGHTDDMDHFFEQMDFLTPNLFRVLKPGRVMAIHVKDRNVPGGMTGLGFQTVDPFHAKCIEHYATCPDCQALKLKTMLADREHGKRTRKVFRCSHRFAYLGMKTIVTDVVRENTQTYRLGWTEQCKDGSRMGVGMPEYLLLFRKPPTDASNGYADVPVVKEKREWIEDECDAEGNILVPGHWNNDGYSRSRWQFDAHGFMRSSGNRLLHASDLAGATHAEIFKLFKKHSLENVYDFEHDVKLAEEVDRKGMLPPSFMLLQPQSSNPDVWTDITRMRTLNMIQEKKGKEFHLCPIQEDLVRRVVNQFTMPGETVFDPFAGLGSVPLYALRLGRKGIGCELAPGYYADACFHLRCEGQKRAQPMLFDLEEAAQP